MSLEQWEQVDRSITTEELDNAVTEMKRLQDEYDAKKKESTEAHYVYQEQRAKVISLLKAAGKTKYEVEGVGKVSTRDKLKVSFPSGHEERQQFFKWLNENYGADGFLTYASVNYNSLNSLYNQEFDKAKESGNADDFNIPGIANPEAEVVLSFRKK